MLNNVGHMELNLMGSELGNTLAFNALHDMTQGVQQEMLQEENEYLIDAMLNDTDDSDNDDYWVRAGVKIDE